MEKKRAARRRKQQYEVKGPVPNTTPLFFPDYVSSSLWTALEEHLPPPFSKMSIYGLQSCS